MDSETKHLLEKIYMAQIVLYRKLEKIEDKVSNRSSLKSFGSTAYDLEKEIEKATREIENYNR